MPISKPYIMKKFRLKPAPASNRVYSPSQSSVSMPNRGTGA